jgi:hypothetical protein
MKMKTVLLLTCSLALAGAVWAEPADNPQKRKKGGEKGQPQHTQQQQVTKKGKGTQTGQLGQTGQKGKHGTQTGLGQTGPTGQTGQKGKHGTQTGLGQTGPTGQTGQKGKHAGQLGQTGQTGQTGQKGKLGTQTGKFQAKHYNLSKGPNSKIASEKFVKGKHIQGSEHWQGKNYEVFRNYHSDWHDHDWWHNHYDRIILIGGGWYFWNAGFWFPAWGYDNVNVYYPYDGPIRAYNNLPPNQVVANVQAALQANGYYTGEVDGLLGPLTRDALGRYQSDNGLYTTQAIDDPTLNALGMS